MEKLAYLSLKRCIDQARLFVEAYNSAAEEFKPGDLVMWKPGMKNVKWPEYNEPIMVLETFAAIRRQPDGELSELSVVDMRCLVETDGKGDFLAYGYDSHRMTAYKGG